MAQYTNNPRDRSRRALLANATLASLRAKLLAEWRTEETGAASRLDSSGNGYHLTATGAPPAGTGVIGNSLSLDGTQYCQEATNAAGLQIGTGAIAAWYKSTASGPRAIIAKADAYALFVIDGELRSYSWGGAAGWRQSGVAVNTGAWVFCGMNFDSGASNGSRLYINGSAVGSAFTYTIGNQASSVYISEYSAWRVLGDIDQVMIFSAPLSGTEWQYLYNSGAGRQVAA